MFVGVSLLLFFLLFTVLACCQAAIVPLKLHSRVGQEGKRERCGLRRSKNEEQKEENKSRKRKSGEKTSPR